MYHDRPGLIRDTYRYDYSFRDTYGLLRNRVIWPRYHFILRYGYGPWCTWRYFYPYYHRKYVFISLGGYWPIGYDYLRYYWYGCHPYYWYGYYPIAREVQTPVYNYYTYNYYDDTPAPANPAAYEETNSADQGPDQMTLADVYFEEAVKAFGNGNYGTAATKFAQAMNLAPDDQILPFAYSQALVAIEQYTEAARVLRDALAKVRPDAEGVFYPRGLYANEETLLDQIDRLSDKAGTFNYDADLQLLLGYQLLGIGDVDRAVEPLTHASEDLVNADAAKVLLDLAAKIKTSEVKPDDSKPAEPQGQPATPPAQSKAMIEGQPSDSEETFVVKYDKSEEAMLSESRQSKPALKQSQAAIVEHPMKWQGVMFLASLCTLAVSAGIRGYLRG